MHLLNTAWMHTLYYKAYVIQVLPHQKQIYSSTIQALQSVIDTETILARILLDQRCRSASYTIVAQPIAQ